MLMLGSCSTGDDSARQYVERIGRYMHSGQVDSLKLIRDELSQDDNRDTRQLIIDITKDSSTDIQAMSLILALNPDEVAHMALDRKDASLLQAVQAAYSSLGCQQNFHDMCNALQSQLDKMDIDTQAMCITSMLTPEQIVRGLQPQDSILVDKISRIYASQPELAKRFETSLTHTTISTIFKHK